ncbi:MAG: NAD(P)/FAD-dependent oxidoreductase [Acidocella sp.]|nr:NAD(P)/FAD-dependent oxidoreductase [Acidocella sp.]
MSNEFNTTVLGDKRMAADVVDVLIVGSGFAGMAMAIKLRDAGFTDLLIIEKAAEVGGTWRDNVYPGCACDIPSHLYSLSFAPKADWSRLYPQQPEIYEYLQTVANKFALRPAIQFNTILQEAAWDEQAAHWVVTTNSGVITARVLISGMGGLHIPAFPKLPGLARFEGKMFHSAQWDHGYDLRGKNVAVVGTGASAIQFVPQIASQVAKLAVFQRTPPWIVPKPDRAMAAWEKKLLTFEPYRRAFRKFLFWLHELRVLAFLGNRQALKLAGHMAGKHMRQQVSDAALLRKLTPDYQIGCKRVMISNDYYPALARPNVALITDGIAEVRAHSIVDAKGGEWPVDAMILGTGFEVTSAYKHWKITGAGGQALGALWDKTGMRAFKGVAVAGFPNFFMLLGPHTALGHNSVVIMIEAQVQYIVDALTRLRGRGLPAMAVTPPAQTAFIDELKRKLAGTVWQDGGCASWYKDEHGFVSTIWPGSAASYQRALRAADLRDYQLLATHTAN